MGVGEEKLRSNQMTGRSRIRKRASTRVDGWPKWGDFEGVHSQEGRGSTCEERTPLIVSGSTSLGITGWGGWERSIPKMSNPTLGKEKSGGSELWRGGG